MARQSVGNIKRLVEQIVDLKLKAFTASSNIVPETNGGSELGSDSKRYANIYCQDLNLANDRGDYTVIEEEEYLSIRNNKTGKVYKFVLEEIQEVE